jgi:hypothetical protein
MRIAVKRAIGFAVLLAATGIFAIATDAWASGTPTPPPAIALIGPSPLIEHLTADEGGTFNVIFTLNVENDGSVSVPYQPSGPGGFNVGVISDRNYVKPALPPTIAPVNKDVSLPAMSVSRIPVTLTVHDRDTTSLQVVLTVTAPSGVMPSTESITLIRSLRNSNFLGILLGSLIVGLATVAVFVGFGRRSGDGACCEIIYTDATFSFSQSWATNIAAVLTVVATVFSTTGVLPDLVPGIDTGFFLAVTITYGVVLALAPLAYSIFQKVDNNHVYGRRFGFQAAATITGIAVGGQLSTVGAVIWLSDLSNGARYGLLIFLGVVAAAVVTYAEATRRQLWKLEKPELPPAQPPTDIKAPTAKPPATMAALI